MKNLLLIFGLIAGLAMTGCGNKKGKTVKVSKPEGQRERTAISPDGTTTTSEGSSGNSGSSSPVIQNHAGNWGEIATSSQYEQTFNEALKGLVSATLDPKSLGYVSPVAGKETWVRFQVQVRIDSKGNVLSDQSFLHIKIKDENVGKTVDGYTQDLVSIVIDQEVTGKLQGQNLTVTFKDGYGQITLSGQIDQNYSGTNYFIGQVDFENFKHVDKNEAPRKGTIGGFAITQNGSIVK